MTTDIKSCVGTYLAIAESTITRYPFVLLVILITYTLDLNAKFVVSIATSLPDDLSSSTQYAHAFFIGFFQSVIFIPQISIVSSIFTARSSAIKIIFSKLSFSVPLCLG